MGGRRRATAAAGTAPFGEAVAAEPSQDHDVDVLYVSPHAQVLRELREGVRLGELVRRRHLAASAGAVLVFNFLTLSACHISAYPDCLCASDLLVKLKRTVTHLSPHTCAQRLRCSRSLARRRALFRNVRLVSSHLSCIAHPAARHCARTRGAGVRRPTRRRRSRSGRSR